MTNYYTEKRGTTTTSRPHNPLSRFDFPKPRSSTGRATNPIRFRQADDEPMTTRRDNINSSTAGSISTASHTNSAIRGSQRSSGSGPLPSFRNQKPRSVDSKQKKKERVWKSAVDPKSGRTYYYDVVTRETQWRKPLELASNVERDVMEAKERKQKDFFASMEANILRNINQGTILGSSSFEEERDQVGSLSSSAKQQPIPKPTGSLVRTISGMNDKALAELTRVRGENVSPTSVVGSVLQDKDPVEEWKKEFLVMGEERAIEEVKRVAEEMTRVSNDLGSDDRLGISAEPAMRNNDLPKPLLTKRNTCGTMYVGSTMSAPDKDATIKCVCGVYRAHLLQSAREETTLHTPTIKFSEYEIFNDDQSSSNPHTLLSESIEALSLETAENAVPPLEQITQFYRDVFLKSQMESDCIIMSLIYIERLLKVTNGGLRPKVANWRSILFCSMILSSKVWDDLSMWNVDFSQTLPKGVSFSLQRINELEVAVLDCLKYNVKVTGSEYAKYYFLLRSMLIRSGLGGSDWIEASPLDVAGVIKLEKCSENFQRVAKEKLGRTVNRRARSLGEVDGNVEGGNGGRRSFKGGLARVSLEQVVHM